MTEKKKFFPGFMTVFAFVMGGIYVAAGIYIIASKSFYYIDKNIRIIFGTFLIAYGVYRLARSYYSRNKNENS